MISAIHIDIDPSESVNPTGRDLDDLCIELTTLLHDYGLVIQFLDIQQV